mmetsp:Transcript_125895/g.228490  ORF Transcript_125895/g.228490 Transcript_125895/m.228490 type:complete len:474 (-) Transcript_125895:2533-3954(-)
MQNLLSIDILNEDPEWLRATMYARVPLEIGGDRQLYHEARPGNRLHIRTEVEFGELVDKLVDRLPHLWKSDQLSNLCTGQVVVALPCKILLLHLPENVLSKSFKVSQRSLRSPHALVNHLAPVERAQRQRCPATAETNLKDCAHDPSCRLLDIHHVRQQGEAVKLQLGDVGLKQHVHLRGGLVRAALHRHRHALYKLRELDLLLLTHRNILELVRQGEETQKLNVRHHGLQVVVECGNRWVLDVVVAGDAPQSRDLHLPSAFVVFDQIVLVKQHQPTVNKVDTPLLQQPVLLGLIRRDAVETWSAHHAHVEIRVTEPVHRVLARLNCAQHQLRIQEIGQSAQELRLNRQLHVVQREVVLQFTVLCDDDAMAKLVILRPACSANHLHHIHGRQLVPHALLWIVHLRALDNHGVGRQVDTPCQSSGGHKHLNMPICIQIFNKLSVRPGQPGMMDRKAVWQQVFHLLRLDTFNLGR